jgi:ferrous iron transport protein A
VRLTDAHTGAHLSVCSLPIDPRAENQVRSLGLLPGSELLLLRRAPFHGPLLLEVGHRTVALGWRVAAGIEVEPAPPEPE